MDVVRDVGPVRDDAGHATHTGGVLLVRGVGTDAVDKVSLFLALGVGACIAGYTLVDDHGVRHAHAIPCFELVLLLAGLPYAAVIGPRRLKAAVDRRSLPAGVGMASAYLLVLAALEKAEAAPVAALRETSVVMAAAFSKQRSATRVLGSVIVVLGIAAVALG